MAATGIQLAGQCLVTPVSLTNLKDAAVSRIYDVKVDAAARAAALTEKTVNYYIQGLYDLNSCVYYRPGAGALNQDDGYYFFDYEGTFDSTVEANWTDATMAGKMKDLVFTKAATDTRFANAQLKHSTTPSQALSNGVVGNRPLHNGGTDDDATGGGPLLQFEVPHNVNNAVQVTAGKVLLRVSQAADVNTAGTGTLTVGAGTGNLNSGGVGGVDYALYSINFSFTASRGGTANPTAAAGVQTTNNHKYTQMGQPCLTCGASVSRDGEFTEDVTFNTTDDGMFAQSLYIVHSANVTNTGGVNATGSDVALTPPNDSAKLTNVAGQQPDNLSLTVSVTNVDDWMGQGAAIGEAAGLYNDVDLLGNNTDNVGKAVTGNANPWSITINAIKGGSTAGNSPSADFSKNIRKRIDTNHINEAAAQNADSKVFKANDKVITGSASATYHIQIKGVDCTVDNAQPATPSLTVGDAVGADVTIVGGTAAVGSADNHTIFGVIVQTPEGENPGP